ncbi:membrane-anchored junction protein isoform X3 [Chlorocebus sabaeus]|uniref:membrane-anchored junction protein isoform X3 n=1 Tax=Chlorocebus sabaeus TaxID=60711 RepID=UPI00045DC1F1|nr:membrane-anchored junction protein isoform X3 [Chlorocebus sabaeus]
MSLKPFTYPFPETRFLHAGPNVYKFKIRYGNSIRGEEIENKEVIIQELEDSIRVVLGNLDNLQPFATEHFIVFPYKSKWERVSHLKFKHGEIILIPYPFVFTLYVEMKWFHENLSPGKPVSDSPLGLVPAEKKAVGAVMRKRKHMDEPSSPSRPGLDRTGKEKPNKDCRRLWPLISLVSRNKILSGGTACQGQLSYPCSTTHLHLRSEQPAASLGF